MVDSTVMEPTTKVKVSTLYNWNNSQEAIDQWDDYEYAVEGLVMLKAWTRIWESEGVSAWCGDKPLQVPALPEEEFDQMSKADGDTYNRKRTAYKDFQKEYDDKIMKLDDACAQIEYFMIFSFVKSSNAFKNSIAQSKIALAMDPDGNPDSLWRSDYRVRRTWQFIVRNFKPLSATNTLHFESLLKTCNDSNQKFAAFYGEYDGYVKKLASLGRVISEPEHKEFLRKAITNPSLNIWRVSYVSGAISREELIARCNEFLSSEVEEDTPKRVAVISGRTVSVTTSPKLIARTDCICFRCGRSGHQSFDCISKAVICSICHQRLEANVRHDTRYCAGDRKSSGGGRGSGNNNSGGGGGDTGGAPAVSSNAGDGNSGNRGKKSKGKKRKHQQPNVSSEENPYGPQRRGNAVGVQGAGASGGAQSSGGAGSN